MGSFFETPPLPFHLLHHCPPRSSEHFFNTDYTHRFKKDFDRLDVTRMSLYEKRAVPHIMYDCILFPEVRRSVATRQGQPPSQYLLALFGTVNRTKSLLRSLEWAHKLMLHIARGTLSPPRVPQCCAFSKLYPARLIPVRNQLGPLRYVRKSPRRTS